MTAAFEEMTEEALRAREEEIIGSGSRDELHDLRCWLFRESVRLENKERSIDDKVERFETERRQFREEMRDLNKQMDWDRRKLREESDLFNKRLTVLKKGFDELAADKRNLEQERLKLETERQVLERAHIGRGDLLFRGVSDTWSLRKRYRDLIKIFHPDNAGGDHEIVQMINEEYQELALEYGA